MKKTSLIPILIILLFFAAGTCIYRDYGASADEHIQFDAGHVLWKHLCETFGRPVPEPIRDAPPLKDFKNSFYGQAAVFPTVVIEALRGFTLDSSTVIRIRHFWNLLCFTAGLCCLAASLHMIWKDQLRTSPGLLLMILLPRIFGDIFYNDRDIMLLSWMMISLAAFCLFLRHTGWISGTLCAAAFGMTFNTRIFGLVLMVFPGLFFMLSKKRKAVLFMAVLSLGFWYLFSPVAWGDPLKTIPEAFRHFATQQRAIDTNNQAKALFFGKRILETDLPWYYIPAYILVTTPLATTAAAILGVIGSLRRAFGKKFDERSLISMGMLIILIAVPLVGIIFRLTFYNGWRHFYFLYLPIVWLAVEGIDLVCRSKQRVIRGAAAFCLAVSFLCSLLWIIQAHPYQIIYLNPAFRTRWIGKFNRDYWLLSTTECMRYLLDNSAEIDINVVDKSAFIEYTEIGLPPAERARFHMLHHSEQPFPYEYLVFNYGSESGNEKKYDYYEPVYAVERDGIKLAEVFQRSHNNELKADNVVSGATDLVEGTSADASVDGDLTTAWYGTGTHLDLLLELKPGSSIYGLEIFPAHGSGGYVNTTAYASDDGETWEPLPCEEKGSNGIAFPVTDKRWLRIDSEAAAAGISDILFYGTPG